MAAPSSIVITLLLTICCFLTSSWATSSKTTTQVDQVMMMDRFHRWMEKHNRSYLTADEKRRRFEVYRQNVEHIEATNWDGKLSYTLGENQFTDLTSDEFLATYTSRIELPDDLTDDSESRGDDTTVITTRAGDVTEGGNVGLGNMSALPESIDWREKGAVTPVKDQGDCAVESLHQIQTGKLVSLSEQQLVDCTSGCKGGYSSNSYHWIVKNGGITTETDYPYTGQESVCDAAKLTHHRATIRGWSSVRCKDEVKLREAVARQPVTVNIDASEDFRWYTSGVFSGPCRYKQPNHIVTIVGYGRDDATSKKYWIVKNSWSQEWGMGGYILMEREISNRQGLCGLARYAEYPV